MRDSFVPRLDILPAAQQALWPLLHPASSLGMVLYGGTAVALRLGHRQSVDFDFFIERPLDKVALAREMPFLAAGTVLQESPNAWTLLVQPQGQVQTVKLSFFGTIGFGRYGEPQWTQDRVMQVAALDDLLATKVKVILQRVERKDYQDIAALLRAGTSLDTGLAIARDMFGPNFQASESLKALTWFEGGDLDTLSSADRSLLVERAAKVRKLPVVVRASATLAAN